jgi:hypothetical protein
MLVLTLTLAAGLAHAGPLATDATGRFVSNQTPAAVQGILADALTRSVDSLPWAFRAIARGTLEEQATACPAYTMAMTETTFRVHCDGRTPYTWALGKTTPFTTTQGETTQATTTLSGRSVTLRFVGETGGKVWTYTFPDSGGLTVKQEVTSPRLPSPMVWTLTFAKE